MQARARQQRGVGLGVLLGVEDDCHIGAVLPGCGQDGVRGGQGGDHLRELGDAGLAAGLGMGQQRDAAVAGHDQPDAGQPQVRAFLLDLGPSARSAPCRSLCR